MSFQEHVMIDCKALVNSIETFGLVDGPGVRFVIFLQGCNMRCQYCHNPETWAKNSDEARQMSTQELFDLVKRYKSYWGENCKKGGVTVSGGEPLLQIDFLIEFFSLAKQNGVNTCLDTSGSPFSLDKEYLEKFDKLMFVTDLFIVDIKAFDEKFHKKLTGQTNSNILEMIRYLSNHNKKMWIRHVLVPNLTDSEKELKDISNFINTLKSVERVEILPYHTLGVMKWKKLGITYPLEDYETPTNEQIKVSEKILEIDKYYLLRNK